MGVARAFARAVSSATTLVAQGGEAHHRVASQSELLDSIDSDAFVGLLALDGVGPGLAVLDQSAFSALIEAMTIGHLGPRPPSPRRATATDGGLLAGVLDALLADLSEARAARSRFDRPVPDYRLLAVLLDETTFDVISLSVSLVSTAHSRPAQVLLAFPSPPLQADPPADTGGSAADESTAWDRTLHENVMRAPASLRAELGRVTLPLAELLALGVGGALTMPLSNLEEVRLVALDGAPQAVGRLGQSRGMRAVRLTSWPNGVPVELVMAEITSPAATSVAAPLAFNEEDERRVEQG